MMRELPVRTSVSLTTHTDTVTPSDDDQIVQATSQTLNASDALSAGNETDVLVLSGSGTFNLAGLKHFGGF